MVEGITLLGGEPFEQAQAVERIVSMSRKCGLSVIIFSGYLYEELVKLDSLYIKKILQQTDILIDGRYEKEKHDLSRPWVGSVNQKYVFLTERYKNFSLDENKIEIRICRDGKIKINGMADIDEIKMWF
jgi:anaerobic ribonucleoside-triphosphate reductase activating protein